MIEIETYYGDEIDFWRICFKQLPPDHRVIYNSPDYLVFLEKLGLGKAVCQMFRENDRFVYFPALLKPLPFDFEGYDLASSWYYGGPIPNWKNWKPFSSEWNKAIFQGRTALNAVCEFIRCDPNLMNHSLLNTPFEIRFNRQTVFVNLGVSWEEVVKGFSPQNRRNIKKAEKSGLVVEFDQSELAWRTFGKIYQQEMVRKNAPSHLRFDDEFFLNLSKLNGFTLFVTKSEEEIIGGFISAHGARIAHHYLSAVKHEHWDKRPNNLLFTEVLAYFHGKEYKLFDFQGGRDGVFRFKQNFSKLRADFYISTCIYDNAKFRELAGRVGEYKDDFFPPYRTS